MVEKSKKNKKVIVAMSGGVDSSVAAALLKKQGYQVIGVFMHFWAEPRNHAEFTPTPKFGVGAGAEPRGIENKCCSIEAEEKARAVAAKLDIPFYVFHFEKEFKEMVVDYFLKEYAACRTPNPCVVCNQKIKFGLLLEKALGLGADFVATGHYARIKKDDDAVFRLLCAKDKEKDQSYFLYTLTQNQLRHLLFPIGDYKKSEVYPVSFLQKKKGISLSAKEERCGVYSLAKKWQLPYRQQESFDICFIAGKNHNDFLKRYLKLKPGKIIDTSGKILGFHQGLSLYTIGQKAEIGGPGPFYVVELNQKNNTLIVTNNPDDPKLYRKSLIAQNVNWISGQEPELPLKCQARIRYRHEAVPVIIQNKKFKIKNKKEYEVIFKKPQRAVTPGQSVVFYQRNEVLGGGTIKI